MTQTNRALPFLPSQHSWGPLAAAHSLFLLQLFQNLRNLMTPYRVAFESPLELSAQGE